MEDHPPTPPPTPLPFPVEETEGFCSYPLTRGPKRGGCSEAVAPGRARRLHMTWKGAQRGRCLDAGVWGLLPGSCQLLFRKLHFWEYTH